MAATTSAIYLYCVLRPPSRLAALRRASAAPAGLPGASAPEVHEVGGSLYLVTARVPMDVYGPEHLEPRLRDLDWVSKVAVAHEAVVEHFARARSFTVIPLTLFTMFSSIDKALEDVRARRKGVERAMRHVAGSEEWGIRILRRPAPAPAAATKATSGTAFLSARKDARNAAVNARAVAADGAEAAFRALKRLAKDSHLRERREEPGTNPPILEAAFLVTAAGRASFRAEARRQITAVAAAGADLTVTGPWPAYHFVGAAGERA
jgi:hypothetical protein